MVAKVELVVLKGLPRLIYALTLTQIASAFRSLVKDEVEVRYYVCKYLFVLLIKTFT